METKYTKLKDQVNGTFTVLRSYGYNWQKWNDAEKKYEKNDRYFDGATRAYDLETDKGKMTVSQHQYSSMLMATEIKGKADINNRTFRVRANEGKNGITYYNFDVVQDRTPREVDTANEVAQTLEDSEPVDMSDIPFSGDLNHV